MIKSLQSKMILVMFLFIFLVILFSALVSIFRMEQVYFRGFEEEMLNTISSFGIEAKSSTKGTDYDDVSIEKLISNFSIYFSINKTNRNGIIIDNDGKVLYTSKSGDFADESKELIGEFANSEEDHHLVNDNKTNNYYFIHFIREGNSSENKYTIVVSQDKTYINQQLRNIALFYVACLVVVSIITIVVSALLASNVTKPIEIIRKKAQLIAARR